MEKCTEVGLEQGNPGDACCRALASLSRGAAIHSIHRQFEPRVAGCTLDRQEIHSPRLARWAQRLAEFDNTVKYVKGDANAADGLSRIPVSAVSLFRCPPQFRHRLA
jgi:hypothetical protein